MMGSSASLALSLFSALSSRFLREERPDRCLSLLRSLSLPDSLCRSLLSLPSLPGTLPLPLLLRLLSPLPLRLLLALWLSSRRW
jgi:hypothetical protein